MKKLLFACSLLLFLCASAHAKFDPAFTWRTLETPHFLIHYHQGGETLAEKAGRIAEDVHARLAPRIRWEPKQKTHIVLVDATDEANGMTSPLPYNQMILFLTQPVGEPGFGTTGYEDWMRLLITHEYTHVLQLDMENGGYGGVMRTVFGRSPLSFPNLLQPKWMIEGLAVYEETEQTSGGRGRSAGTDMVLRMAMLEGKFPPLDRMGVFPDTWPSGQVPYLFGWSFTEYIAKKYGREKLAELSLNYSSRNFPFLVNSTGIRTFSQQYRSLYYEWKNTLRKKYEKQRDEIAAKDLTRSTALTRKGYKTISPVYSPDGSLIAYFEANGDEFPGIYLMNADGTGDRKLIENLFPSSASGMAPAWSADGARLFYTKEEVVRNTNLYVDVYSYDLKRKKELRITKRVRGRDPHPSPDGKKLVFVVTAMGMTRLALLDISGRRKLPAGPEDVVFLTDAGSTQYETPRWSPDGSKIAVGLWQPGGCKDIWILDAEGKKLEEVTHDRAVDGSPAWAPDGKHLYFASDRTGVFNLFAYELETKRLYRITNVLGGAFTPCPGPDNKSIAYTSYSANGYDIHAMPVDQAAWEPAEPYADTHPVLEYEERLFDTSTRPYNPLPTVGPRFWLPWFGYSSESGTLGGFITIGQDVVQRHTYAVTGLYGPKTHRVWYSFDYFYDGLYPTVHLHASDQDETYANLLLDPSGFKDYVERQERYGLDIIIPLLKTQTQHALTIGYQWKEMSHLTEITPLTHPPPFEGVLASGRLSYLFNSARRYNFSISPEQGRTVELGYERFDKSIGSDLELNKYTADWHEYLNLPWPHQVLQVRAFAGTSTGQTFPQGAFQMGGDLPGDLTLSIDDRSVYLRGYPVNQFRGQNAALGSLEYRFPVTNIETGTGQSGIFFRRLHGAVFAEAGNAWSEGSFHGEDAKRAVGAEARLDLDIAYGLLPVTLRAVIAKGLDEFGELQAYISFWARFGL